MAVGGICKDCISGVLHSGTPAGAVTNLHGLPTYVADAPASTEPKGVIVVISDIFGWELPNTRVLADNYARKTGMRVLVPDFMGGRCAAPDVMEDMHTLTDKEAGILSKIPSGFKVLVGMGPVLFSNRQSVATPRIMTFFRALRAADATLPVGAAGFCWGGKYTTILCAGSERTSDGQLPLIDAGFTAHPSMLEIPKEIEAVTLPYSVAHGTEDVQLTAAKIEEVKKVFAQPDKQDICELVEYEGAKHGFAVRGNKSDEKEERQGMEAEEQAVRFFQKWLVRGESKL